MVAKGYIQRPSFDFTKAFIPVIKLSTIRVVFTLALAQNWEIRQLDVNNAFLNGIIHEIFMLEQPSGFEKSKIYVPLVCKLHRALYGLRQASRARFDKLKDSFLQLGFMSSKADQSLFLQFTSTLCIYLLVYVDDIIITRNNSLVISTLIFLLNKKFSLKDFGTLHYFLGIEVQHTENGGMLLSQEKYLTDILRKTKMVTTKAFSTPMVRGLILSAYQGEPIPYPKLYRSIVGALQYATITILEIFYNVNKKYLSLCTIH